MKKPVLILFCSLVLIAAALLCRQSSWSLCRSKQAEGVVSSVYLSAQKELVCKLRGIRASFSMQGFSREKLQELKSKLMGRQVRIQYADRWTPLDPSGKKDVDQLSLGGDLVYKNSADE